MAMVSKTKNMLEGLVREGSFKWLIKNRSSLAEEFEEMGKSPTAGKNWLPELSPIANIIVRRCSKALSESTQVTGYLEDKKFRRLTFDMMIAWEFPSAVSQPFLNTDEDVTVGLEAFSRIAPAVPIIANVIISDNLFEVLTASTGGRLQLTIYEKYLSGLERNIHEAARNRYEVSSGSLEAIPIASC
ncbi:unnamed protein product [Ilex paraguariensis]|uniref:Uncharacterized protein n=1 Tax=Ilex paraguariensis TaxID=185542 RepID=A0ABC8QZY1_9AQUA